ncbi:hypothetical protein [Flaviflexus equikiangi]|uniref:hypothetical protein n=1 Tax=Flaviflexus equikiangi TaxID=2758573 RepID=UPI0029351C4C|nr:hypothetical protein [Flaviflexus equikiangi]
MDRSLGGEAGDRELPRRRGGAGCQLAAAGALAGAGVLAGAGLLSGADGVLADVSLLGESFAARLDDEPRESLR